MLRIADLEFSSPLVLAPLAGYSDLPFRLLCRRCGAGFVVTEMVSCHGLVYRQANTLRLLDSDTDEGPLAIQLFGADPVAMGEAAALVAERRPAMIDINMGCPVRKVTRRGAGAALMTTPQLAAEIIAAVVARAALPVTVKMRSGRDQGSITAPEFAAMAESCGAAAVIVHARTWGQGFSGQIDPEVIAAVKRRVAIPVIGNGDVLCPEDANKMMADTGCDGVMIGRGALGNPWIFAGQARPQRLAEIAAMAADHLALIERFLPAERLVGHVKGQLARYFKGFPGSAQFRAELMATADLDQLRQLVANAIDSEQTSS